MSNELLYMLTYGTHNNHPRQTDFKANPGPSASGKENLEGNLEGDHSQGVEPAKFEGNSTVETSNFQNGKRTCRYYQPRQTL